MLIWCSANIFSSFSFIFCNIINAFDASLLNKSNTFLKNTKLLNGSVYYSYYVMYLFRPFKRFVAFLRWYVKFKTLKLAKSKMYFPVFFVQYALDCRRSEYVAESMSIWFLILFEWLWTQRNNAVSFSFMNCSVLNGTMNFCIEGWTVPDLKNKYLAEEHRASQTHHSVLKLCTCYRSQLVFIVGRREKHHRYKVQLFLAFRKLKIWGGSRSRSLGETCFLHLLIIFSSAKSLTLNHLMSSATSVPKGQIKWLTRKGWYCAANYSA